MKKKTMRYAVAVASTVFSMSTLAHNNYALGPVESSNSKADVVVLGQKFAIDGITRCIVRGRVVSRQACAMALSRDTYAAVEADVANPDHAAAVTVFPFSYIPGASKVMVGSWITRTSHNVGQFRFGGLVVDETALMAGGPIAIVHGDYVEVSGIQPVAGGALLADSMRFSAPSIGSDGLVDVELVSSMSTQSIAGTGLQSISGSGVQSIAGTGIRAITGTGSQSIAGTGAQSIAGTGAQSIAGTGAQSIAGTGTQSIAGTGIRSIAGTGTQSITGTGTQSIAGTGVRSITGTGTQSIAGTGTRSIAGTGAQSIAGTGTRSIAGTGRQSIAGTGAL
jgi:hypothetical protein